MTLQPSNQTCRNPQRYGRAAENVVGHQLTMNVCQLGIPVRAAYQQCYSLADMVLPDFQRPVRVEFVGVPGAEALLPLLELEHREFEAVLGQPVQLGRVSSAADHVWQVVLDPDAPAAQLCAELNRYRLSSVVPTAEHLGQSLNLLHSLAHSDQHTLSFAEVTSYPEVLARVRTMVENVYPYSQLRGLEWEDICSRYANIAELPAGQFWTQLQRLVAELGDAHTTIIPAGKAHHPPYIAEMTGHGALLHQVPEFSAGHRAGARNGWVILVEEPDHWMATTGASVQHHALVAARRFMQIRADSRRFTAQSPAGDLVHWEETPEPPQPSVTVTEPGVRISRFDAGIPKLLAQQLRERQDDPVITIDLRGNVGGNLVAADQCRRMLLHQSGEYGHLRYSDGQGGLSPLYPLLLEPIPTGFTGDVRILVDQMTYSAAEDFLQPLVGLDHVRINGGPTGGGSGRPTTVPLMDGYSLRVSTTITYTRAREPVEHFGIGKTT